MPVQVECPGCLTPHTLADEQVGTRVRCTSCLQTFLAESTGKDAALKIEPMADAVPVSEEPFVAMPVDVPPPPLPRRPERDPPPPRAKKKMGAERVALLVTAVFTVFLICGAAGAVAFRVWQESRRTPPIQRYVPSVVIKEERPIDVVVQPIFKRIPLDCPVADVEDVFFSDEAAHVAAVLKGGDFNSLLDRYDLVTGQRLSSVALNAGPVRVGTIQHLSLSLDGTRFAYNDPDGNVFIVSAENSIETARFRPYPPRRGPGRGGPMLSPQRIARIDLITEARLLTVNPTGDIDLWDVPQMKPVFHVPARRERAFSDVGSGSALSHDRKTLAIFNGDGFDLSSTGDGLLIQKTGQVAKFNTIHTVHGTAFSPDGKRLAAIVTASKGNLAAEQMLISWEVATGQFQGAISVPHVQLALESRLAWWGMEYLLTGDKVSVTTPVITLPNGPRSHNIQLGYWKQRGFLAPNSPDGRFWYVAGSKNDATAFLTTVDPPDDLMRGAANRPDQTWWLTADGVVK